MTTKKITLNADKRKVIADQFQSFYEDKVKDKLINAKEQYNAMREKAKVAIDRVVRFHQPQEDVDTIRSMIKKYNRAGGELYEDNCFYVQMPIKKVDDEGREYDATDEIHVRFDMSRKFARAYYRDEMRAKGLNPDFNLSIEGDYSKRNPKYYNDETAVNTFLGYHHSRNDATGTEYPKDKWENDFKLWTIGSSYCHSRNFKVDENTFNFFKMYRASADEVINITKFEIIHRNLMNEQFVPYYDDASSRWFEMIENKSIPLATVEDKKVSEIMRRSIDRMMSRMTEAPDEQFIEEQLEDMDWEMEEFELSEAPKDKKKLH